jgi:hypothetical protein
MALERGSSLSGSMSERRRRKRGMGVAQRGSWREFKKDRTLVELNGTEINSQEGKDLLWRKRKSLKKVR